jgi:hypothetical protein
MSDRALLWGYAAAEAASIAQALNVLADDKQCSRRSAIQAQEDANTWSWNWAVEMGLTHLMNPTDRLVAIRDYLADNLTQLEELTERVLL